MQEAPLLDDIAHGPPGGRAFRVEAPDGVRLRLGHWPAAGAGAGGRGTVFLFPGRTEYIEKYGGTAADLAALGFDTLVIDWRGQGLSDRPGCADPMLGHVRDFADYQLDIAALRQAAQALALPRPHYLLSHSMGGCIALRALQEGLEVAAAAFSAPMWGIRMAPPLRPFAWSAAWLYTRIGKGCHLAPGTSLQTYVTTQPFEDNQLTTDRAQYEMLQAQARAHPELTLGGPTMQWLLGALVETRRLRTLPPPAKPALTFLGTRERIVDTRPIHALMRRWGADGRLEMVAGAEHEVLLEGPQVRARIMAELDRFFR